jgi:hypothetical protein
MAAHLLLWNSHGSQCTIDSTAADRFVGPTPYTREYPLRGPSDGLEHPKNLKSLSAQRDDEFAPRLPTLPLGKHKAPFCRFQIEICPLGLPQFARPDEYKRRQVQRAAYD